MNGWAVRRSIGLSIGAQAMGAASPIGLALLVGCAVKLADTVYPLGPWPAVLLYGGAGIGLVLPAGTGPAPAGHP